ncbi:MAG: cell envelope integrity protein TolA [Thermodesulfobacteriota bacterium]
MKLGAHLRGNRALALSAAFHILIFATLLLDLDIFSWRRSLPEVYQVDLVEMSEAEEESPQEEESPPPEVEPPPPPPPPPEAQSSAPLLSSRVMPKSPDEIPIIRPRASKKTLSRDVRQVMDAFARIREREELQRQQEEAEERLKEAEEKAMTSMAQAIMARQIRQQVTGNSPPAGPTSRQGSTAGVSSSSALRIYKAAVHEQIRQHWVLPQGQEWDPRLKTVLVVRINENGALLSHTFDRRSGNPQFDRFVSRALEKSAPLPPLPADLAEGDYALRLTFFPKGLE